MVDAGSLGYHTITLSVCERLTVVSDYDDDFDTYMIIRSNGEVIQIRSASGPSPEPATPKQRR